MPTLTVTPTFTERSGELGSRGEREYSCSWEVLVSGLPNPDDAALVSQGVILSAPGIPARGSIFVGDDGEFDAAAVCVGVSCRPTPEAPWRWEVTAKYSTNPGEVIADPTLRPPRVSWDVGEATKVAETDRHGDPIVNSAGDLFDPPLHYQEIWAVATIVRNEPYLSYNHLERIKYINTVNDRPWLGVKKGWAKIHKITAKEDAVENGVHYREVTYVVHISINGLWTEFVLDQGTRYIEAAGTRRLRTLDVNTGGPTGKAVNLDGFGHKLADGADPVYLPFDVLYESNFDDLNLSLA